MADKISSERRSENMRRIKSKDTKPELAARQLLFKAGYRYRLHRKDLPGKPDIVFAKANKAIFVHGCFWHGHENCVDGRIPKSRTDYWPSKIAGNKARDERNQGLLKEQGWEVLVIWECETRNLNYLEKKLLAFTDPEIPLRD